MFSKFFWSSDRGFCTYNIFLLPFLRVQEETSLPCNYLLPFLSTGPSFSTCDRNNGKSHFPEIFCVIITHLPEKAGIKIEMNLLPSLKEGYTDSCPRMLFPHFPFRIREVPHPKIDIPVQI